MNIGEKVQPISRKHWRKWLSQNGKWKEEIWVVFYNKGSGRQTFTYNDGVEEAICFGWIDGIVRSVDKQRYAIRFSPRRDKGTVWSEVNRTRARKMIKKGQMTVQGADRLPNDLLTEYIKARKG